MLLYVQFSLRVCAHEGLARRCVSWCASHVFTGGCENQEDLVWKIVWVGSAKDDPKNPKFDQVLDEVDVPPDVGINKVCMLRCVCVYVCVCVWLCVY
jgi:hypothetical protein